MSKTNTKVEEKSVTEDNNQPTVYTKSDYIKAKATINAYKEQRKNRPKRPCTEKQLAALAAGRAKNNRNKPKQQ